MTAPMKRDKRQDDPLVGWFSLGAKLPRNERKPKRDRMEGPPLGGYSRQDSHLKRE